MITGNRRCPLFTLKVSAANAQNWAVIITPKMLTQTKNVNEAERPNQAAAAKPSMVTVKNTVIACSSRAPSSRRRNMPYAGTRNISTSAVTAWP